MLLGQTLYALQPADQGSPVPFHKLASPLVYPPQILLHSSNASTPARFGKSFSVAESQFLCAANPFANSHR